MKLKNLNELAVQAKTRYNSNYKNKEVNLHQEFKDAFENYLKKKGDSIYYLEHSAEITIGKTNNKIFLPNQWFSISTFLTDFVKELINYKTELEYIREHSYHITFYSKIYWDLVKNQKDNNLDKDLETAIIEYFKDDYESIDYMKSFLTNYAWWNGKKTIDRIDFFVSPVLNILGVVNVTQAYIAEIVYSYASDEALLKEANKLLEYIEHNPITDSIIKGAKNLIVYGAPGTGKSRYVNDNYTNITRVVFHPEYTYYDFVGTYKPTPLYKSSQSTIKTLNGKDFVLGEPLIDYSFVPGPFINVIINALRKPEIMHTLLIEEINRANAASVFGDMFQLLDRKADGTSEYTITPSTDLLRFLLSQKDIESFFQGGLFLPSNINIIATMNSADQGVYVLDSAFKRRWNFKYIKIIEDGFAHQDVLVPYAGQTHKWKDLLRCINKRLKNNGIEEDKLIGPYFINTEEILTPDFLTSKLFIYLWDDVLRYKRNSFFAEDIITYSDLVSAYHENQDILNITEILKETSITQSEQENDDKADDE